jgi:hypothetical protein
MLGSDAVAHLLEAVASLPPAFEQLVRLAAPRILALEAAVCAGGSVWVFDVERAAQREPLDVGSVIVEEHGGASTELLLTTWRSHIGAEASSPAPPAGSYALCLVDGNDVRCVAVNPRDPSTIVVERDGTVRGDASILVGVAALHRGAGY